MVPEIITDGAEGCLLAELWYALQVRPNAEIRTRDILRDRALAESFLPSHFEERRWSQNRARKIEVPWFRGYCFGRFDVQERRRILEVTQVVSILGDGQKPIPIPDIEIQSLRTLVASPLPLTAWPRPAIGASVYLEKGPLKGAYAVVVEHKNQTMLVVEVKMLGRGVRTPYREEWIGREDLRRPLAATVGHPTPARAVRAA